jgi:hypothetical protein
MDIKQFEQAMLRPQIIEGVIFKRLPSFFDWVFCIALGYGVGTALHMMLN